MAHFCSPRPSPPPPNFFGPRQKYMPITVIHNWVQFISPCSQWLARCHVTIQRCSAAPAPKLSGTEKLLPCHRLTLRRSFFPDWQTVGMPMCSLVPRFQPRWAQTGICFQYFFLFARSGEFRCSTCLAGGPGDV